MDSKPDPLKKLEDDIEKKIIQREARFEAIYEMLSDAGVDSGKRIKRESLARKLENQGMEPEELDLLIGHARVQKCEDWRGLFYSWLRDIDTWRPLVKDLTRSDQAMGKRELKRAGRASTGRDHENSMPHKQRIFYAFFFDQRPKEEIARLANMTPTEVLEIFKEQAAEAGIPKREIERRLRWAQRTEEEARPDLAALLQRAEETAMPVYGEDECT
jgi:hypothetical protein